MLIEKVESETRVRHCHTADRLQIGQWSTGGSAPRSSVARASRTPTMQSAALLSDFPVGSMFVFNMVESVASTVVNNMKFRTK